MALTLLISICSLTSIFNMKASDTLIIIFNSKDVNQYLHTLNGYDIKDSNRKVYYQINAFHYQFCKDFDRSKQIYHYVFSSVSVLDSTLFHSKYRKENIQKKENLLGTLKELENKNGTEATYLLEEIKMISEFINPTKAISISEDELRPGNSKVVNLSELSTEKEILSLEKIGRAHV